MSPRDLPVWARAVAAVLFLAAGWFAGRSSALVALLGDSTVEVSVGVVAVSFMIGMRIPPDLWPRAPWRSRFSLAIALGVAVAIGGAILAAGGTGLPGALWREGKAAIPLIVGGAAVWAVAWGRTPQEVYGRWFGVATAAAVLPVAVGALASGAQGQLPPVTFGMFAPVGTLYLVVAATGGLVTQELAFRRLLVGQAGDAGLIIVLGAAVAFGLWHLVIPAPGSSLQVLVGGVVNGLALGALYALSRSLLVAAWYHGVQLAAINALRYQTASTIGAVGLGDGFWMGQLGTAALAAGALGWAVWRRNGWRGGTGPLSLPGERDGPPDPDAMSEDATEENEDVAGD